MRTTLFLLLTLLSTAACQQTPPPVATNSQPAPDNRDSLLLTAIFGHAQRPAHPDDCLRNSDKWHTTVPLDSTQFSPEDWKNISRLDSTAYVVEHVEYIQEQGLKKALVALSGAGDDCHICPGVVDCAVLTQDATGWKLNTYHRNVTMFGVSGYPGEVEVRHVGDDAYLMLVKNGSTLTGGHEWRFFTGILYDQGRFSKVFKNPVTYTANNWSGVQWSAEVGTKTPAYAYTSVLYTQPGQGSYRDLIVHYQGTQLTPSGKGLQLLDREVRFAYRDGFYATRQRLPE